MNAGPISLTLDVPPSANVYWRCYRNRMVRSDVANGYANKVLIQGRNRGVHPLKGPVVITLHWYRAMQSGDLDNRCKATLDSLQGVAYVNDAQVVELHAFRHDDKEHPRMEVTVRAAGQL